MYSNNYSIPRNNMNIPKNFNNQNYVTYQDGERFFLAPLVVGGLAGTALGYGIANNNQLNNKQCCGGYYPMYPVPYYPYTYSNNYYY